MDPLYFDNTIDDDPNFVPREPDAICTDPNNFPVCQNGIYDPNRTALDEGKENNGTVSPSPVCNLKAT